MFLIFENLILRVKAYNYHINEQKPHIKTCNATDNPCYHKVYDNF